MAAVGTWPVPVTSSDAWTASVDDEEGWRASTPFRYATGMGKIFYAARTDYAAGDDSSAHSLPECCGTEDEDSSDMIAAPPVSSVAVLDLVQLTVMTCSLSVTTVSVGSRQAGMKHPSKMIQVSLVL